MTNPISSIATQIADLQKQVNALAAQQVTYTQAPVVSVNTAGSTFGARIPNPADGTAITLTGIVSPAQFLPSVGQSVTIALAGPVPIYQPTQVAPGTISPVHLAPNAPNAPTGLTLSTSTVIAADGTVHGQISATWTAPGTTVGGSAIVGALTYVVQYRATGSSGAYFSTSPATTSTLLTGSIAPGTSYDVQVAAVDQTGNVGAYTAVHAITVGTDTTAPNAPTAPTVSNYLGQLKVTWDGNLSSGALPADFDHVAVHVGTTSGFTPSSTTEVGDLAAAGSAYATATYGSTMWAKLVAVDRSGNASSASAAASGSTSQVVAADITAGAVGASQLASLAVTTAKIAANAVGTSQLASLAVTSAQIANAAVGNAQIANLAVASANIANAAVGTAQIANLAVNDAQIGACSVGKLTAGTMTVDVVMGGRFATALTGARVEMNSTGFQKFDSSGTALVSFTGTDNYLHGEYKTATSGRRIEILSGGSAGNVDFYSSGGIHSWIKSWTENFGAGFEAINMGMDVGGHVLYNRVNVDNIPQIRLDSMQVYNLFPSAGWFKVSQYSTSASWNVGLTDRFVIDGSGFRIYRPNGSIWLDVDETGSPNPIIFTPASPGLGSLELIDNAGQLTQSPRIKFVQQDNNGILLKAWIGHIEVRDLADTVFEAVFASAFTVSSDAHTKTDIQDVDFDGIGKVMALRPRQYVRVPAPGSPAKPPQIGLLAQEAPPEILSPDVGSDGTQAIDLYAYVTLLAVALQQGMGVIDNIVARLAVHDAKALVPMQDRGNGADDITTTVNP